MKKISQKLKGWLLIALAVAMLVQVPAQASFAATQKQMALNAYNKWLSAKTVYLMPKGRQYASIRDGSVPYPGTKASDVKFSIIYLDNDAIPEMVVYDNDRAFTVLTYRNGKIVRTYYGENFTVGTQYYPKKNVFVATGFKSIKMIKYVCKISGKYFVKFQDDVKFRQELFVNAKRKRVNLTEAELRTRLKAYTKGASAVKIVYHANTAANRKRFLK